MKANLLRIIGLISLLTLTGCVTYETHEHPYFPQAVADKGLLYFYRLDTHPERDSECYISRNHVIVGRVFARSYTFVLSDPGLFMFRVVYGAGNMCRFQVEAGEVYFFRIDQKPIWGGFMGYHQYFVPVTEEEAMTNMQALTYISMERK